jgi:hypothetical protein
MRKAAVEKLQEVVAKGYAAVDSITGYDYIKSEVKSVVAGLSIPIDEITITTLEESLFKMSIISFAADMDVCRTPNDKVMFENASAFKDSLSEAVEFFKTLAKPESNPVLERPLRERFLDIAYQGNVLLFYVRGEIEKMGSILSPEQKKAFSQICDKINEFISFTHSSTDEPAFNIIADKLYSVHTGMIAQADKLDERGGAVRYLAEEFKMLAGAATKFAG